MKDSSQSDRSVDGAARKKWRPRIQPITRADLSNLWKKSTQDLVFTQATALAYTSLLSLVPILAVAFFIFHAFGGFESLQQKLQPLIEQNLAPAFSDQLSQYLENFISNVHAKTIGVAGIVGFIITSISTLATIERTFNLIWGANRERRWGQRITAYWSLLTIGPLLLGLSLVLSSSAITWLKQNNGVLADALSWGFEIFPYMASGLLFTALYMFMPNVTVDRRDALKAGFATGLVFEGAKLLYALYATHSLASNKIYGSLVIIPVFLVWLYVVWLIILFGAEFCCYLQFRRLRVPFRFGVEERLNPFVIVDIVEALGEHQKGPRGGMTIARMIEALKIPMREISRHLQFLQSEGWVVAASGTFFSGDKFFLTVAKDDVDVSKIFAQLENRHYAPVSARGQDVHRRMKSIWDGWTSRPAGWSDASHVSKSRQERSDEADRE